MTVWVSVPISSQTITHRWAVLGTYRHAKHSHVTMQGDGSHRGFTSLTLHVNAACKGAVLMLQLNSCYSFSAQHTGVTVGPPNSSAGTSTTTAIDLHVVCHIS